jgi:hypothetical protein
VRFEAFTVEDMRSTVLAVRLSIQLQKFIDVSEVDFDSFFKLKFFCSENGGKRFL